MPNHLANSTSPYLLQHASNPVDWYPWGPEALEKARAEQKPIFLSIGYAACHWCHVMAHESFEDPATAAVLNRDYVSIKVDREERPDIDSIYMSACVAMTRQGGWPLSVFITPEGEAFYAGTYFPPTARHGLPAFRDLLEAIARAWKNDRENLLESGSTVTTYLRDQARFELDTTSAISRGSFDRAVDGLIQSYDRTYGGWGSAPKFPQPMSIEALLRAATLGKSGALDIALHALKAMSTGGLYDVVGGGFHRYSTDARWLVPHFEKMLYDNAQLALVYLHAYQLSGDAGLRRVCEQTLDFVLREMSDPDGGFYSSLDADSEGGEGSFYVWTPGDIRSVLDDLLDANLAIAAYNVSERGNFEQMNILQRALDDDSLAARFNLTPEQVRQRLDAIHKRLLDERNKRARPGTDDKIITGWNALMLQAFAEAARALDRSDYRLAATRSANFLLTRLRADGHLLRAYRAGRASHLAYLEDHAALVIALIALYQTDPDPRWYTEARGLITEVVNAFEDPAGGFFDTHATAESLLLRPKDLQDNATPSGNALATFALLLLDAYDPLAEWRERAERMLATLQAQIERYPTAFAYWLSALDFALGPVRQVVLVGVENNPDLRALASELWSGYRPRLVTALVSDPPAPGSPMLASDRPRVNGQATAYVCEGFICRLPVTSPAALREQLADIGLAG